MRVELSLSPEAFLAIYTFLLHTKLGEDNKFEKALTDIMLELENEAPLGILYKMYGTPELAVSFSEDTGLLCRIKDRG